MTKPKSQALARIDPGELLTQAIQNGATVDVMERLLDLERKVRADTAREAWYTAMAGFQEEAPDIPKNKTATVKMKAGGTYQYKYASLDSMIPVLRPILAKYGLSTTFKHDSSKGSVTATCRVAHEDGHVEETGLTVPVDSTAHMNVTQQVGAACTYARRYALLAALGLSPEDDNDAQGVLSPDTVQMPKRKAQASKPATVEAETSVETTIEDIETREGETKGKAWTRYGIKCGNGETYGTFSETVMEAAQAHVGTGESVCVWYNDDGKFKTATGVTASDSKDEEF